MIHGIDSMHYGASRYTQHVRRVIYEADCGCNWRASRDVFVADVFRDKTRPRPGSPPAAAIAWYRDVCVCVCLRETRVYAKLHIVIFLYESVYLGYRAREDLPQSAG